MDGSDIGSHEQVAQSDAETLRRYDIKLGDILQLEKVFTYADVAQFGALTADFNPIHMDDAAAKQAGFSNLVVHGMLCSSLFPTVIARRYPGAVYVSQTLKFVAPVFVNEPLRAQVEVMNIANHKGRKRVTFSTKCFRRGNSLVILGDAMALIPTTVIDNARAPLGNPESNCTEEVI
ncbi:hypothetical protein CBR_g17117 [Chara braunii]|uniref:MaoC-like domain-containing protein n=1 Tax=Chara braunii TaxID=69332 RepID=A0A388KUU8_CHABU|nr:hypothetical protein CBR_g17117 [Chara braunii]|eukprot:GBG73778.1 hypothetical protein CBR_g17117 [Chara braunii]